MAQRGIVQGKSQWYLIASCGEVVLRVHPGMALGETAAGELSFDPSCAQLELDIADDGGLLISGVQDHELKSAGGKRCRRGRLACHRRAEIRLPHNVLQLDTDFVNPAEVEDTVEISAVRPAEEITEPQIGRFPERLPGDPADAKVAARPPRPSTAHSARRGGSASAATPLLEQKPGTPLPRRTPRPTRPDAQTVGDRSTDRRTERAGAHRQRLPRPLLAALIGLAGIGFALLYPALREARAPEERLPEPGPATAPAIEPVVTVEQRSVPQTAQTVGAAEATADPETIDGQPDATVAAPPADVGEADQALAAPAIETAVPPPTERSSIPQAAQTADVAEAAADPETIDSQPDATVAAQPADIGEPALAAPPAIEPVAPPPAQRRSIPQAAQTVGAAEALAENIDSQSDAITEAEPADIGETALATEQARRRDLLAADLALAQGRLMTPPEASAYTLYNRVLALDPGSPEASSGLQSVRQGLINRALAQLAGDALDDADRSLQAAADAGANPMLVADLRGEVDYRQRLTNAQAGRFETLYPVDQLVAVSQEPPRVPRNAATGTEMSVEVQFTVTESGDVRDVAVLDDPPENLKRAVRRAVRNWRFEPVLYNGRPMPVRSSTRFTFRN